MADIPHPREASSMEPLTEVLISRIIAFLGSNTEVSEIQFYHVLSGNHVDIIADGERLKFVDSTGKHKVIHTGPPPLGNLSDFLVPESVTTLLSK